MTKSYHIFLGWGLVFAVTLAILIGLPRLAGTSADFKDQVKWQKRASNLQNIEFEYYAASNFAKTLTSQHLDRTVSSPYMLDYLVTADIPQNSSALVANSKAFAHEVSCLAEAVYYEARSETISGQKAVAEVILNRVGHKAFPNTVCAVVYQGAERTTGCQFSFACDGSNAILPRGKNWSEAQDISRHMMMRASAAITNRATHYHTTNVNPKWAPSLRKLRQYDTHVFYRFMPRKRRLRPVSVAP